ncbi:MAG: adenylate/guanylate cyclase domain-containing protein [SAR324 cluster bacterium]|nr:adenylate/guanylate cyclase domain-containing protein [SAR324 cluster bacterium]MEE2599363.1 adenylate/guanylate cyclase domain-containing protein [SAR324 cluster bacterium]
MGDTEKKEQLETMREAGIKAGIVPVQNLFNEEQRIEEVKRLGILDLNLSSESRYNSMTQVATYLTDCPQSTINILGSNVQQCKASFGFEPDQKEMMEEIPREISVCQFGLAKPGQPLIIENILEDDRTKNWKNMPFDPGFRFYASLPLMSSRGFSIGTLCVFDPNPKNLDHQQIDGLRLLSDQIVHMLEKELNPKEGVAVPEDKSKEQPSQMKGQYYSATSILFADFIGFTNLVENSDPGELLETLNIFFNGFDKIISKHNVLKVKTVGDCYMCVGGIPSQQKTHAKEVCAAAIDLLKFVEGTNIQYEALGKPCWELRIGIHSGAVIAGSAGNTFDIWGDAVNIAARLESSGESGKIHISQKTKDYLEGTGNCTPRGEVELKNKGSWSTYFLNGLN